MKMHLIMSREQHCILGQGHPLEPGITDQENDKSSKDSQAQSQYIEKLFNVWKIRMVWFSCYNSFSDSH